MTRLYFAAMLLLCGCSREAAKTTPPSEPVLSHQYRQDSVTVVLSLSETNIATTGKIQLTLAVQAPPGIDVAFPEVEQWVEPFSVSGSWSEPQQTLPNGKILYRSAWQCVPSLPGNSTFPPMAIVAGAATITTEPIPVSVRSILPAGLETFEIKDIAAPATLLPEQRKKEHLWLILLGSAIAIVALSAVVRLHRKGPSTITLSPHDTALLALENLPDDPVARIHELNHILRAYIETRFDLPMVGKTTQEILPVLEQHPFTGLADFLERGEVVRFSNRVPDGFAEEAEHYVRQFIAETKQEEPCD